MLDTVDHLDHDNLFKSAMARAQELLLSPLEDPTIVYAEQIFKPDEILTEKKVGERFEEWKWPILKNWDSCYNFIKEVEKWYSDHLAKENYPEEHEQHWDDSELIEAVLDIGKRRSEDDLFQKIYALARDHEPPLLQSNSYRGSDDGIMDRAWRNHLIRICFGDRTPVARSTAGPRITRRYRPWGLFRYLRLWAEGDEAGGILNDSLKTKRSELATDREPYPVQSSKFKRLFGPLDVLIDLAEENEGRRFSVSKEINSDVLEAILAEIKTVDDVPPPIGAPFQEKVIKSVKSKRDFDPYWTVAIKDGLTRILLSGSPQPFDKILEFISSFYMPLVTAYKPADEAWFSFGYGFLDHALPEGWNYRFSKGDPEILSNPPSGDLNSKATDPSSGAVLKITSPAGEARTIPLSG